MNAQIRSHQSADEQDGAHFVIYVSQPRVRRHSGRRSRHHLAGAGSGCNGRRNAQEHQNGRHQKPAAYSEKPGERSDDAAYYQQHEEADAQPGYRHEKFHAKFLFIRPGDDPSLATRLKSLRLKTPKPRRGKKPRGRLAGRSSAGSRGRSRRPSRTCGFPFPSSVSRCRPGRN